jgi:hypothetical protein
VDDVGALPVCSGRNGGGRGMTGRMPGDEVATDPALVRRLVDGQFL